MKAVFLCGAGGAGKSSVALELAKDEDYLVMQSSTRATYARLNIPTETSAFALSLEVQQNLQNEIMEDHLAKIQETVSRISGNQMLVIDRSPFDHLAYWTRTNALDVNSSMAGFMAQFLKVTTVLESLHLELAGFFDFPYPTFWPTNDGQRDQNPIKTFEMSLMTSGMIHRYGALSGTRTFIDRIGFESPVERAAHIKYEMTRRTLVAHGI
jgi:hypothetical protein